MGKKRKTTEEFILDAIKIHGKKYDYSKVTYINNHEKVCIICQEHGEFWQTPNCHLSGQGCPKCAKNHKDDKISFIHKAKIIHGNKYNYSKVEYIDSFTKVCIICPEHGEFWQTPNSHLTGRGCPECRWRKAKQSIRNIMGMSSDDFIKKAISIHGLKYDYSKVFYENTDTKVCIICPEHGEFWQTPHHHLKGCGCPECGKNDISEKRLADLIENSFGDVIRSYKPLFLKENGKTQHIDIFLQDLNVGIEYQGKQHFVPVARFGGNNGFLITKERDERKYKKCIENGVNLLYFTYEKEDIIPKNYISNVYTDEELLINEIKKIKQNAGL